ncbi:patatin-like phospholipase family protein [Kribbella sp. NBC_01245]|uniref:patatin-like phospholipase family protein n=1 Tax=Kribbella sp. NBC_01245 TaxID=2903578 RepID=UPI002E2933E5|nr:patatin-like phospholipase family protein [Kribbella sp. NBC_01245]
MQVDQPHAGTALCLSGGGYRAMLFHAGALWRLNELGQLAGLKRVSSVSGGSITAGLLGLRWSGLGWQDEIASDLRAQVIDPLIELAGHTIDVPAVLAGVLLPRITVSSRIQAAYARRLFGDATLQDLPDSPRFVITATNLQTGSLWRFTKRSMRDWQVGGVANPTTPLALAVAASSAFPPVLSPTVLRVPATDWEPDWNMPGMEQFRRRVVLSDGGVYDNLGLQPVIENSEVILVSDGGGELKKQRRIPVDWPRAMVRVMFVLDREVRAQRSRALVDGYRRGEYGGAYWGIRTPIDRYDVAGTLPCQPDVTAAIARTPTRLKALPLVRRQQLVNWGYAVCDAAMRHRPAIGAEPPDGFPFPDQALDGSEAHHLVGR